MRIRSSVGLIAAAAILAACNGPTASGLTNQPGGAGTASARSAHALVAPGLAGRLAILPGTPRPASHRMHHNFVATRACTYLTDSRSGDVQLYNKDLSLAGDFGSTAYGWGAYASANAVYLGQNGGTGSLDLYTPCTNHLARTLTGVGDGGAAYGITSSRATKSIYATDWPSANIEYWANGSTTAALVNDPNMGLPYFLDADLPGNVYVVGYDTTFAYENLDECTPDFSSCTTKAQIYGGFPGGVQVDQNETVYVNDQYGTLYSYDCSSSTCSPNGSFTYKNGGPALDYTGLALDKYPKHKLWAANIYLCTASLGICGNAQSQSVPLNTAAFGAGTAGWPNAEPLGIARFPADRP